MPFWGCIQQDDIIDKNSVSFLSSIQADLNVRSYKGSLRKQSRGLASIFSPDPKPKFFTAPSSLPSSAMTSCLALVNVLSWKFLFLCFKIVRVVTHYILTY